MKEETATKATPEQIELRKQWLAALRSGNYKQGRNYLCRYAETNNEDEEAELTYCCLGVLLDLTKERLDIKVNKEIDKNCVTFICGAELNGSAYYTTGVPDQVKELIGLRSREGRIHVESYNDYWPGCSSLAVMNDSGRTFQEIADYIECHPRHVFVSV